MLITQDILIAIERMLRSFQIVEDKVTETDFFINKIEELSYNYGFGNTRFLLSAFLSASRSITFSIKASISDIDGFDFWYKTHEQNLNNSPLTKYFLEARNYSQKVGYYPLTSGRTYTDKDGRKRIEYYFDETSVPDKTIVPEMDVLTACKNYFVLLLGVVYDCYQQFGAIIDPDQYFTVHNLNKIGKSIDDMEEELGFPGGWTCVSNGSIDDRIEMIRKQLSTNAVDEILIKYLGKNRFGEIIKHIPSTTANL